MRLLFLPCIVRAALDVNPSTHRGVWKGNHHIRMTTDLSVKSSALPVWDVADLQPVLETAFGNGGTFRDLLVALSSEGPCLISGAALREALDACQIRQALDEFLPYP